MIDSARWAKNFPPKRGSVRRDGIATWALCGGLPYGLVFVGCRRATHICLCRWLIQLKKISPTCSSIGIIIYYNPLYIYGMDWDGIYFLHLFAYWNQQSDLYINMSMRQQLRFVVPGLSLLSQLNLNSTDKSGSHRQNSDIINEYTVYIYMIVYAYTIYIHYINIIILYILYTVIWCNLALINRGLTLEVNHTPR